MFSSRSTRTLSLNVFPCGWRKSSSPEGRFILTTTDQTLSVIRRFIDFAYDASSRIVSQKFWLTSFVQITLSGFGFVVGNFLTLLWYTPTLDQDCPPWVYLSWAIGLFLYQTFDAVDGSQARRTHQSGPLGELFDHGVDAINTTLEVLLFSATMNLGQGWKTVLTLFACKCHQAYRRSPLVVRHSKSDSFPHVLCSNLG